MPAGNPGAAQGAPVQQMMPGMLRSGVSGGFMPQQTMGATSPRPMGSMAFPGQGRGVEGGFPGGREGGFPGGRDRPMHSDPMPMPGAGGGNGIPAFDRPTFPGQGNGVAGGFPGQGGMDRRPGVPVPAFDRPNAPQFPGQGAGGFGPQAFGVPGGTGQMPPQQLGGEQGQMARQQAFERLQGMGLPPEVMQRIMSHSQGIPAPAFDRPNAPAFPGQGGPFMPGGRTY